MQNSINKPSVFRLRAETHDALSAPNQKPVYRKIEPSSDPKLGCQLNSPELIRSATMFNDLLATSSTRAATVAATTLGFGLGFEFRLFLVAVFFTGVTLFTALANLFSFPLGLLKHRHDGGINPFCHIKMIFCRRCADFN